ncbi:MAG: Gfo/Idh/MocA family oxidoreductase [Casimicrobiaceae bacterium]
MRGTHSLASPPPQDVTNSLRIGIAGCGWATQALHVPALRRAGVGAIVAVSDPREQLRAAFPGVPFHTDWREMLTTRVADIVLVATPPAFHAEVAIAALEAGCHVLLEKPVATNRADALRIAAAVQATNRIVVVGFNQRCHPVLLRVRAAMAAGLFGTIEAIDVTWHSGAGLGARDWLGERARGGGALFDLGSHVVDLWRFLTGDELEMLHATSRSVVIDDETAMLDGRLRKGTTARAHLSLVGDDRFEVTVRGSRRSVTIRPYGRSGFPGLFGGGMRHSYESQWRDVGQSVLNGSPSPCLASLADGIASLEALLEASACLPTRPVDPAPPPTFAFTAIASTTVGYGALRTTIAHLRRQTIVGDIELVLVGPSIDALAAPADELQGFAAVQRIAVGTVTSIAHANAAGVRGARGRVVALTEDHCFPEPEWAAALVRAHAGDASVVGPVVRNANPRTQVSEADFVIGYGLWMEPMPAQRMAFLPGHNSSYKRDELLALGGRLERLLEAETVLHLEWSAQGRRLMVEPGARVRHVNYSRWRSWVPVQVLAGRLFGGMRAVTWSRRRKLFYAAASPLIPAVRLWRIVRAFGKPGRSRWRLARTLPALVPGLLLDGLGQGLGYLLGPGDAMERLSRYEFNRIEHVREEERALWTSP